MNSMRNALARAALCAAAAATVLSAHAGAPDIIRFDVDDTFKLNKLSATCGFPIYRHDLGTVQIALFSSRDGAQVIREIDTVPGYTITLFSPLSEGGTGASVSGPVSSVLRTLYPEGVFVGAPATLYLTGLNLMSPGLPQAGREVYLGEIVFVDDAGVPFTEPVETLSSNGHFTDAAEFAAARCASLQAP